MRHSISRKSEGLWYSDVARPWYVFSTSPLQGKGRDTSMFYDFEIDHASLPDGLQVDGESHFLLYSRDPNPEAAVLLTFYGDVSLDEVQQSFIEAASDAGLDLFYQKKGPLLPKERGTITS